MIVRFRITTNLRENSEKTSTETTYVTQEETEQEERRGEFKLSELTTKHKLTAVVFGVESASVFFKSVIFGVCFKIFFGW